MLRIASSLSNALSKANNSFFGLDVADGELEVLVGREGLEPSWSSFRDRHLVLSAYDPNVVKSEGRAPASAVRSKVESLADGGLLAGALGDEQRKGFVTGGRLQDTVGAARGLLNAVPLG